MIQFDVSLKIRPAEVKDAITLWRWWNDHEVMTHAGFPLGLNLSIERIEEQLLSNKGHQACLYILEKDQIAIGEMNYRIKDKKAEIGIKICEKAYQNQGLGPRYIQGLLTYLFEEFKLSDNQGIDSVILDTNLTNLRAQKTYERLGFMKTGVRKDAWKNQLGVYQSAVDYEMTRNVYQSMKPLWEKAYIKTNQKAWEHAFDHRQGDYAKDMVHLLNDPHYTYLNPVLDTCFQPIDLKNKTLIQLCCNNGRELLSLAKKGLKQAIGFDLASNMVDHANAVAQTLDLKATFIQSDVLEITDQFNQQGDILLITIGALCWFHDLKAFFNVVHRLLKPGGQVVIHEIHPVVNMLATPSERAYDPNHPSQLVYDYFKEIPWETGSMGYMTEAATQTTPFLSFSHSFSSILNAAIKNQLNVIRFEEYDVDYGNLVSDLNHKGIPLSYLFILEKKQ